VSDDSNRPPSARKAIRRPGPDFPLRKHKGRGYWCKKVRGRVYYFGKVADDPTGAAALDLWLAQKDDLLAGREPRPKTDGLTVAELANRFLAAKEHLRETGELTPRTWQGYYATCATVVKAFGRGRAVADLVPDDFRKLRAKLAQTRRSAVALGNEVQRVRSLFKFAFDDGLIPAPVRFGQAFAKPKADAVRRAREAHRNEFGDRMFEPAEIRAILAAAGQPLRAMVLLAANCAFGQSDLAALPTRAVDLDAGWVDFARVKTGIRRRCWLWPETAAAVREWVAARPKAKDPADAGLLFLTRFGGRWVKVGPTGAPADAVGQEFGKVLARLGLKRPGRSVYALRHTFETVAGETADQVAVDAVMGHVPQGMGAAYRERISDARLRRVAEFVRRWLFGEAPAGPSREGPEICDPSDPCDPAPENEAEPRGASGAQTAGGAQARGANPALATRETPTFPGPGADGAQGLQISAPGLTPADRPRLRIYRG
jgi:integrase